MWLAFGCPDSLQEEDDEKKFSCPGANDRLGVVTPMFRQRAARKVREYFRLYRENVGKHGHEIDTVLRVIMKTKRQHRTPPVAGFSALG